MTSQLFVSHCRNNSDNEQIMKALTIHINCSSGLTEVFHNQNLLSYQLLTSELPIQQEDRTINVDVLRGFGVIMQRLEKKNINSTSFFLRRMLCLFIVGGLNLALWNGDILHRSNTNHNGRLRK